VLFNVFAIRGEEYRDPRVLIPGIDNIIKWAPEYLVATHGPALGGKDNIREKATRYRDSIQFMWDQTVRGINKGWTADEIASRITLPSLYDEDYLTSERYGVTEHHLRQIFMGLRGWFDGDESKLFPEEPTERYAKLISGFGGRAEVASQAAKALEENDIRWATELATWLVRSAGTTQDERNLLAKCLRVIAERTPAANIRNWCIEISMNSCKIETSIACVYRDITVIETGLYKTIKRYEILDSAKDYPHWFWFILWTLFIFPVGFLLPLGWGYLFGKKVYHVRVQYTSLSEEVKWVDDEGLKLIKQQEKW
jgi:hypothetical protein